jgi:hypothetical protein
MRDDHREFEPVDRRALVLGDLMECHESGQGHGDNYSAATGSRRRG